MKIRNAALIGVLLFAVLLTSYNNGIIGDGPTKSEPIVDSRSSVVRGNLLTNPSFENGNITPWKAWDLIGGKAYIGSQAHDGSKSLRLPFVQQCWLQ